MPRCVLLAACLFLLTHAQAATPNPPPLHVTFPQQNVAVNAPAVRFSGWTSPKARLTVNGKRVRVYPSGAFVGMASLSEGKNILRFRAVVGKNTRTVAWPVQYLPPPRPLPDKPTALAEDSLLPDVSCVLLPGDAIKFRLRGSAHGQAWVELDGLDRRLEMAETSPGLYETELLVRPEDQLAPTRPVFHLHGRDGHTVSRTLAQAVEIRDSSAPRCGEVAAFRTRLYHEPAGQFAQTLPRGAPLLFGGSRGNWQEVWLGLERFWLPGSDLFSHPTLDCHVPAQLFDTLVLSAHDALIVRVFTSRLVPVHIMQASESILRLEFNPVEETSLPKSPEGSDPLLLSASWEEADADARVLSVQLAGPPQWGFGVEYGPGCIDLRVPRCPLTGPPGDLSGLVVMLDPGHGGYDRGCVSPTGLFEKDLTLGQALLTEKLLRERGATVELSRRKDVFVPLEERVRRAEEARARLFVSLHFNSLSATTDPLIVRGSSVWYEYPSNLRLAESLQARLLSLGLGDHGVHTNQFRVLLGSDFPCVLVEHLFLSHPEDEMDVLPLAFRKRLGEAVADGITDWAASFRPAQEAGE